VLIETVSENSSVSVMLSPTFRSIAGKYDQSVRLALATAKSSARLFTARVVAGFGTEVVL
jgi:hypothetical protein